MADDGSDGEGLKYDGLRYDADHSDLGEYENVDDVVARTKRRLRAQRAKQRREIQRALEEDERRKVAREALHQARLKRLEQYRRQVRKRIMAPPKLAKQLEMDTTLRSSPLDPSAQEGSVEVSPTPPPKPAPGRSRRPGPRTRRMQMRQKRQAEARSRKIQNSSETSEHREAGAFITAKPQVDDSSEVDSGVEAAMQPPAEGRDVDDVILRAKVRVARRKQEERRRKLLLEEEQSQKEEEVRQRNEIAEREGRRQVLRRLEEKQEQEHLDAEKRAAWLEEQKEKKREKAAADAILLPKVRAEAAKRGKQWLLHEKELKEKMRLEEVAQQKARLESKQRYKRPKFVAKVKKYGGGRREQSQAVMEDDAACKVVPEARGTVSTEYCSTPEQQGQQHQNPEMVEKLKLEDIDRGQAIVADEAAHKAVGEAVASIVADYCVEQPQKLHGDVAEDTDQILEGERDVKKDWNREPSRLNEQHSALLLHNGPSAQPYFCITPFPMQR